MPVIRCGNHDRVDVFSVENFSIVAVRIRLFALALFYFRDVVSQHVWIDIGQSGEISKAEGLAGDRPALITKADGRKNRAVI